MPLDLGRFRETFFQEAAELLEELEAGLLRLERAEADPETINAVFRAAHSIKGGAGMLDMAAVVGMAHCMESLLEAMRNGDAPVDSPGLSLLLRATDALGELVRWERQGGEPPPGVEGIKEELTEALTAAPEPAGPASAAAGTGRWRVKLRPDSGVLRRGVEPLLLLRELDRLGRIGQAQIGLGRLPSLAALDPLSSYLDWNLELECKGGRAAIEELLEWFGIDGDVEPFGPPPAVSTAPTAAAELSALATGLLAAPSVTAWPPTVLPPIAPAPGAVARPAEAASRVRVAVDKIDQLVTLAGELAVAHSTASEVAGNFRADRWPELEMALADIGRQVWLLQQSVMSVRMLPVSELFGRLPRLVRELESATGKRLLLELDGEDVELDKSVAERLGDPLIHLVRNSADHGIESLEERLAAGKPAQGSITVRALHEGGGVVVEITDDGRGLDAARIRSKAIERGLIAASAHLSEQALFGLIFEPGFSTAEQVTSVSGRGVGMDVVRRNIERLGGAITLASRPGRGTQFRISVPLTLAILDGLLVSSSDELYLIPMTAIVKSVEPGLLTAVPGFSSMMLVDGEPIPMGVASVLLGLSLPGGSLSSRPLAVILQKDKRRAAILVDELVGRQQVIVRSLEDHYRKAPGLLGASILGDGRVALILDPGWLLDAVDGRVAAIGGGSR